MSGKLDLNAIPGLAAADADERLRTHARTIVEGEGADRGLAERIIAIVRAQRQVYQIKRDREPEDAPFDSNKHYRMQHTVEAFDNLEWLIDQESRNAD